LFILPWVITCKFSVPTSSNYFLDGLAQIVDTVVNHYGLKGFIGLGAGVGSNVLLRYAVSADILDSLLLFNLVETPKSLVSFNFDQCGL
jgi:hypothetical protein